MRMRFGSHRQQRTANRGTHKELPAVVAEFGSLQGRAALDDGHDIVQPQDLHQRLRTRVSK